MKESTKNRIALSALLIFAIVLSMMVLSRWAGSAEARRGTIESIDDKVTTVMELTAASTAASAAVSAMPGDTATPIAQKLADFSTYFLIVLCALYLEKYLVTVTGFAAFGVVIPLGLAIGLVGIWFMPRLCRTAMRIITLGIAVFLIIPASLGVSDMIYSTYDTSIRSTIRAAKEVEETEAGSYGEEQGSEADSGQGSAGGWSETGSGSDEEGSGSFLHNAVDWFADTTADLTGRAADMLNHFIEALAVLIVTSCLIPILVVILFIRLFGYIMDQGGRYMTGEE